MHKPVLTKIKPVAQLLRERWETMFQSLMSNIQSSVGSVFFTGQNHGNLEFDLKSNEI